MSNLQKVPGFGSSDPTDNRKLLDWKSRYPVDALKSIGFEALYLGVILLAIPWLLLGVSLTRPNILVEVREWCITGCRREVRTGLGRRYASVEHFLQSSGSTMSSPENFGILTVGCGGFSPPTFPVD